MAVLWPLVTWLACIETFVDVPKWGTGVRKTRPVVSNQCVFKLNIYIYMCVCV